MSKDSNNNLTKNQNKFSDLKTNRKTLYSCKRKKKKSMTIKKRKLREMHSNIHEAEPPQIHR